MSIKIHNNYLQSRPFEKAKIYYTWFLSTLLICIFAGLHIGCFNLKHNTTVESEKNEFQEKENRKILQREESLKLFGTKLNEFVKLAPRTKLAPQPYLKGKTVIVDVGDGGLSDSFYYGFYLTEPEIKLVYPDKSLISSKQEIWSNAFGVKSIAEKADDVQTVIQLKFTDTKVCRSYGDANDYQKMTQLCGVQAVITIIDKTIPAIIAKKTFTNNKLPEVVLASNNKDLGYYSRNDYYEMYPFKEIEEYLKNLEQK